MLEGVRKNTHLEEQLKDQKRLASKSRKKWMTFVKPP
jgi:hypothetical protein